MNSYEAVKVTVAFDMRAVTEEDIAMYREHEYISDDLLVAVSISNEALNEGSPKIGDFILRNPKDHEDIQLFTASEMDCMLIHRV